MGWLVSLEHITADDDSQLQSCETHSSISFQLFGICLAESLKRKTHQRKVLERLGSTLFVYLIGFGTWNNNIMEQMLREIAECTVCNKVPRESPIWQCKNGHLICKFCLERLNQDKCPYCQVTMNRTDEKIRSLAIEKVTDLLAFSCKHKDSGCTFTGTKEILKVHEREDCDYR